MNGSLTANVVDHLLGSNDPRRPALRMLRGECTYGELQDSLERVAALLLDLGAAPGERVILAAENSPFWAAAYLGALRAGLVCVPLPAASSAAEFRRIVEITGARFALAQALFVNRNRSSGRLAGLFVITDRPAQPVSDVFAQVCLEGPGSFIMRSQGSGWPQVRPDDLAALMFTSGSTGQPRGVMVTHRNITANTDSINGYLELTAEDRVMCVLPWHYCFGVSLLHTHLRVGGSLVIDPRFAYPEDVLNNIEESACTGFAGVPSHFQILLRNSTIARRRFTKLRYVQQAGGRLAPVFVRELCEALPHVKVFIMYGQTEATARLSYLPPEFINEKPGSIGRGIPGVRLRVLDSSTCSSVKPGEVGEIVAEGDNIAQGYWQDPDETARTFRGGVLHTGDLATVDDEGFIFIVDRARDILKCGGKRVSCREIEDKLLQFEDLLEVAVVGIPDDILGEAVKIFAVPRSRDCVGFEKRLAAFCVAHLPSNLRPKETICLSALPKGNGNKVLKWKLKEPPAAAAVSSN